MAAQEPRPVAAARSCCSAMSDPATILLTTYLLAVHLEDDIESLQDAVRADVGHHVPIIERDAKAATGPSLDIKHHPGHPAVALKGRPNIVRGVGLRWWHGDAETHRPAVLLSPCLFGFQAP